ncbi:MAG TPA: hypothetical protein VFJ12_07215 [Segeticoccus sp.]|jgi:hypothetical protein|nr:hypothetical protein [Segeticoccus sp.]
MNLHPFVAGQLADHRMTELRLEAARHRRASDPRLDWPKHRLRTRFRVLTVVQGKG